MIWFTLTFALVVLAGLAVAHSGRSTPTADHAHAALWDYQRALADAGRCLDETGSDICWADVTTARQRALPFVQDLSFGARSIVTHPDLPNVIVGDTADAAHACLRLSELLCAELEAVCPWVTGEDVQLGLAADAPAVRWRGGFSHAA